ncbi:MAG: hypothetical protein ABIA74_04885 [bacterium]
MKKFILFLFMFFGSIFANKNIFDHPKIQQPNLPLIHETGNFKLYCIAEDKQISLKVLDVAEKNFEQCSINFNHKYSNKINLYIFHCLQDLHDAVGMPDAKDRVVNIYEPETHSFFTVNPENHGSYCSAEEIIQLNIHGLTNLFIKDKYTKEIPFWFTHGLGLWKAKYIDKNILDDLTLNHELVPSLQQLENFDFSTDIHRASSYLIVEFINQKWGWEKILDILEDYSSFEKILDVTEKTFRDKLINYLDNTISPKE